LWFCVSGSAPASAHPLGNFTINHLGRVSVVNHTLRIHYVLDIAEIPSFQFMQANGGKWNGAALSAFANGETQTVIAGLHVRIDSSALPLRAISDTAITRPGAGGLPILRWAGEFAADLPPGTHAITVDDAVYSDRRIGWKDLLTGTQRDPTNDLRTYPSALIGSPRRIASMQFRTDGDTLAAVTRSEDGAPVIASTTSWVQPAALADMFTRPVQTPFFIFLTILAALALGALHALEPGHGKALLAFTLVGARATPKQAVILAGSLTLAHTAGVFILGIVLFAATGFVSEAIYPWITLASGAVIAVIGARSLARFIHARRGHIHAHEHMHAGSAPHAHDHHHDHEHDTSDGHGHSHAIPGSQPLGFSNAVWAAVSGGIAPCPAAIVVVLAALRLHHLAYGMLLIVVFSIGLACVLSGLGLAIVRGAAWLSKRSAYERVAPFAPLFTAGVISIIGSFMLAQGIQQQGVRVPVVILAALALSAIAGFALSQNAHHHHHSHLQPEGGRA
ncbi:MAG TPA: hypothetical protein VFL13_15270, partial [Candidatus Baltobacteraceae bacterium]|nr:hypothetical protein [Candidatus Baltobacteraceae bacterium]